MSVNDINPDMVLKAVDAGADDLFKLAHLFGVIPTSHTLQTTIAELVDEDRLVVLNPDADHRVYRWAIP